MVRPPRAEPAPAVLHPRMTPLPARPVPPVRSAEPAFRGAAAVSPPWRFGDGGGQFHGYHSWNAYCGRALPAGPAAAFPPRPVTVADPVGLRPPDAQSRPGEVAIITAYRRRLNDVHRLAEQLDHLRRDPRFIGAQHTLPAESHHALADAVEVLSDIRDVLLVEGSGPGARPC